MESVVKILRIFGPLVVQKVQQAIAPFSVTGKSAKKIRFAVDSPTTTTDRIKIFGPTYLETGRGPRKSTQTSEFNENINEWVRVKYGSLPEKKQKQLARYLQLKINREGDETFKKGGREVYSDTLVKAVEEMETAIKKDFRIKFLKFVKNAANGDNDSQTS